MIMILHQENLIVVGNSGVCSGGQGTMGELAWRTITPRTSIEPALPQRQVERCNPDRNPRGRAVWVAMLIAEFKVHMLQNRAEPYWAHVGRQRNLSEKSMERAIGPIFSR